MQQLNRIKNIVNSIPSFCGLDEAIESCDTAAKINSISDGMTDLSDYIPYRYFDEDNGIFVNDLGIAGFMLEISPVVGFDNAIHRNLQHFFNREMPQDSYMQFLLVASNDVEDVLNLWERDVVSDKPLIRKMNQKIKDFTRERATNFGSSDGRMARDYRIFVSYSQQIDVSSKSNISKITSFRDQLFNKLSSIKLSPIECDAKDLIRLTRSIIQMQTGKRSRIDYNPNILLSKQILEASNFSELSEDSIRHSSTGLKSRLYHIKELPSEFSLSQGINLLGGSDDTGIAARFIISYTVANNLSGFAQEKLIARGEKVIESAGSWYNAAKRDLRREAEEWKDITDRAKGGERFLNEHWQLMVTAPEDCFDVAAQDLTTLYNMNFFDLETSKNLQMPAMLSMMPMAQHLLWNSLDKFKLTRTVLSKEVISRLPIQAEWKGVPKSGLLLQARRGQLFLFNPFYKISSGNFNIIVFAESGGGKSVLLQALALSLVAQNTRMFVLEIGESFKNICSLLGGERIKFGKKAPISLNPFSSFKADMEKEDYEEFFKCTKGLLEVMCGVKGDPVSAAELERAIASGLIKHNYDLDITKFANYLESSDSELLRRYGVTLYPYTEKGSSGKYFSGDKKSATFREIMTVFEFEEIKSDPELIAILLQILLMEITNQFLTGDRKTPFMIVVDEAWALLDHSAKFFAAFVRTVRKYGGSLVMCVQTYDDFQKTEDHRTILKNSTWSMMLKQNPKGLESFKKSEAFGGLMPLISSISLAPNKYAEVMISTTDVNVVGRLVLDEYSGALFSTDAEDFSFLKEKESKGVGLDIAVEELVQKKRASQGVRRKRRGS